MQHHSDRHLVVTATSGCNTMHRVMLMFVTVSALDSNLQAACNKALIAYLMDTIKCDRSCPCCLQAWLHLRRLPLLLSCWSAQMQMAVCSAPCRSRV
jgi:hypothetical protein